MSQEKFVVLNHPLDYFLWIQHFKTKAGAYKLWQYADPDGTATLIESTPPIRPRRENLSPISSPAVIDASAVKTISTTHEASTLTDTQINALDARFQILMLEYRQDCSEYDNEMRHYLHKHRHEVELDHHHGNTWSHLSILPTPRFDHLEGLHYADLIEDATT
jgi:hypothetical protein